MRRIILGIMPLLLLLVCLVVPTSASAAPVPNVRDCDTVLTAEDYPSGVKNVTVQEGGSCTLAESLLVTGGVHAKKGAENLYVHTATGRNIQAMGVTDTVHVGPEGCGYDPEVGNNVMVKKSHNVLICWVTAGNNIKVTGNDGRITVRHSVAGNNIDVSRNLKYTGGDTAHRWPGAIRLFDNEAGNHIFVRDNDRKRIILRRNTPEPTVTTALLAAKVAAAGGPGNFACRNGNEAFSLCVMTMLTPQADGTGFWFQGAEAWIGGDGSEAEACPSITYNLKVTTADGEVKWDPPANQLCDSNDSSDVYDPVPFKIGGNGRMVAVGTLLDNGGADSVVGFQFTVN